MEQLQVRFGDDSLRLQRLKGMVLEAQGKLDEAQKLYDSILEKDATHLVRLFSSEYHCYWLGQRVTDAFYGSFLVGIETSNCIIERTKQTRRSH